MNGNSYIRYSNYKVYVVEIGLSARGPNIIILQYDLHIMFDNAADCMLCVMHMLFGSI